MAARHDIVDEGRNRRGLTHQVIGMGAVLIVVLFGCSREPKPDEWTGGYDRHEHAGNLQVRYACKTWHAKEDTVSYALFCQAETAGFSFDGHSFGFVLAGPEAQQLQIPYVSGRQYWIKPDGSHEIIEKPWSIAELRMVSQLFDEQRGIVCLTEGDGQPWGRNRSLRNRMR